MTDELSPPSKEEDVGVAEPEKQYTKDELSKIVRERLKNLHAENESLSQKLEEMKSQEAPAPGIAPQESAQVAPEGGPPADYLTEKKLGEMLAQKKEEDDASRALEYHLKNSNRMVSEDDNFASLVKNTNLKIPDEVLVHLSNSLSHEQSKKLFRDLLSNETSNLKMQNAYLSGSYNDWLQKVLASPSDFKQAPTPVPDLGNEAGVATQGSSDENVLSYLKGL